jgi:hypothetical protein
MAGIRGIDEMDWRGLEVIGKDAEWVVVAAPIVEIFLVLRCESALSPLDCRNVDYDVANHRDTANENTGEAIGILRPAATEENIKTTMSVFPTSATPTMSFDVFALPPSQQQLSQHFTFPSSSNLRDNQPPKKKRASKACVACHSRKVRCDATIPAGGGEAGKCSNCAYFGLECRLPGRKAYKTRYVMVCF